ncbi:zinc finger MYM-type protein 6 [Trichonephila inaurata madagascariensis]|uniref:Zinc finger MYM-type protein 6 n=1 Tax=Trichonephila inaurata madagascariensis TaxID=2747483 RepID=A0A8X6YN24_9ARAC|nr:zinc finger MYM-type protein 6 [Trichonephila inaurata madagascariensis]
MKPSKLLLHLNAKHPGEKKSLEYFERKKREHEGQKKFMRATTSIKENALRASYLVAYRIAKTKKPFTIGEELILPATKDICHEPLGEAAVEKIAHVPLSADTVTRRIEEIAEDIEAQLFERINASPWNALQVDESTDIDKKAILLAYVRYLYQENVHEDFLCALPLPTNTTGAELFKSLDGYISRQLK